VCKFISFNLYRLGAKPPPRQIPSPSQVCLGSGTSATKDVLTMLYWYAGMQTEFKVSIGKSNKYLKEYLDLDLWTRLMKTFNMGDYESSWNALITTCELFEEIAPKVGKIFEYEYNYDEAKRSFAFIKHIKELPKNATEIY